VGSIREFYFKHRKRIPLICYIILLILATINVSMKGGAFSYVLFYAIILYLPISAIYILFTLFVIEIYQETENKILYKNTAEKYQFVVKNSSVIPISGIIFTYDDNISYFTNDFTKEAFRFLPRERVVIDTEIICRFAGGYDAGIEGFYVQDIFGIMRFKRNVKIPVRVHVLPVITDVAHEVVKELSELADRGNLFNLMQPENYLGNDIRKYNPGDSLNRVHWKNYARTGEMFVRLPEKQESEMISLVLVTEVMDGTLDNIKRRDRFLEYLVSVGEYFGMSSRPLMIIYYDMGVKSFIIDSPETFHSFYAETMSRVGIKHSAGHEEELTGKEALAKAGGNKGSMLIFREETCILEHA